MLQLGELEAGLQLDVIEAATTRGFSEELAAFENARPQDSSIGNFIETLEGGDVVAGETVAQTHLAGQCARCHKFESGSGSNIGPQPERHR